MNVNALTTRKGRGLKLLAFALLLTIAVLVGWRWTSLPNSDIVTPVSAQTDVMLERRLSQVEQRFYYIESRLNQIENQSRYPGIVPGTSSTNPVQLGQIRTELDTLRTQIDSLRSRVGEVECGLLRLDERTLSQPARDARRRSAAGANEPCRTDTAAPLKLSVRP
jgi:hypothetical protein